LYIVSLIFTNISIDLYEVSSKMSEMEHHWMEVRQKKYRDLYGNEKCSRSGGIFGWKRRQQLLGLVGKSGGRGGVKEGERNTIYDFWYRVRETVKTALIDLQLFIETASDKDANLVLNKDSLESLVHALLYQPKEDTMKVKIAQMFAEQGLGYLRHKSQFITQSQMDSIDETIEMTKQLTVMELPENQRKEYFIERRGLR